MSGTFKAARESPGSYVLSDLPGGEDIRIDRGQGLWLPGKRPGDVTFSGRPASFPQIVTARETYTLVRRITRGGWLSTDYEVDFLDAAQTPRFTAQLPAGQLSSFSLGGENYEIELTARFIFRATLRRSGAEVAQFRETTNFWSFTSRKTYALETQTAVDNTALACAFFMATLKAY
ncbi:MAG: hypothetical protein Q8K65_03415 [Alphaproteobacteria bacterium]|nr:hypothetical protein [Alphaproteobacteria bacterium]